MGLGSLALWAGTSSVIPVFVMSISPSARLLDLENVLGLNSAWRLSTFSIIPISRIRMAAPAPTAKGQLPIHRKQGLSAAAVPLPTTPPLTPFSVRAATAPSSWGSNSRSNAWLFLTRGVGKIDRPLFHVMTTNDVDEFPRRKSAWGEASRDLCWR